MIERYLNIAGIRVRICADSIFSDSVLREYIAEPGAVNHSFFARIVSGLPLPVGAMVYCGGDRRIYRDGERTLIYQGDVQVPYLCAIRQGEDGTLEFLAEKMPQGITGKQLLNAIDLPHLLTRHDGFLLHASFVEHEGSAILFTAPSETGKSTQAQLWCDYAGAELVNGDRAAVRIIDGEVFACGTPFSGSSPVRRNVILPLRAIVYLSQAPVNSIHRLKGVRAFRHIWEGCTVNFWDRSDLEPATNTVSEVASRVPVYHLACTPDVRAVELLKHTLEVET